MKFWLMLVIAVAAVQQVVSGKKAVLMYNSKFDNVFVNVMFLKDFEIYVRSDFVLTQKCYSEISKQYKYELDMFTENTDVLSFVSFHQHGMEYYNVAEKAAARLHEIGKAMLKYEKQLTYKIECGDQTGTLEEIKKTKKDVEKLFVQYLKYKNQFMQKPPTASGLYDNYYEALNQVKWVVIKLSSIYKDFKQCQAENFQNNF